LGSRSRLPKQPVRQHRGGIIATVAARSAIAERDPRYFHRHDLAAAVAGEAEVIVTANLRHVPQSALALLGMRAESPDAFLISLYEPNSDAVLAIVAQQAAVLRRPPMAPLDIIDRLSIHAPAFADRLSERFQQRPI
jgi:hypothetical protein